MATKLVRRSLSVDIKGLAGQAIKELLIKTAREVHAQEMQRGFDSDPRRLIDNRFDAAIADVKPFGRIILSERVPLAQVALWVYETMRVKARSFRKSGRYESSITIFVERTAVDATLGSINAALERSPNAAVRVAPIILYANLVERRHKVVDAAYRFANNRFGKSLFVRKETLFAGTIGSTATSTRRFTSGKRLAKSKRVEQAYPSVRLYRSAGVGSFG